MVQPPEELELVDRMLAVTASPEPAGWDWAEKTMFPLAYYVPVPTLKDIAALAQSVGGAAGDRIMKRYGLLGTVPRLLMIYKDFSEDSMTSDFMAMANGITSNLLTLIDALQGTTFRNERQLKGFHHFFFMSVTSTSTDMYRPLPILPHAVGTHWLLRVLRQAIYKKGARNDDRLLANVDSNSVIFGISYEVILLRQIKDGSLRHSYNIPGHSGLKLPHVADGAVGFDHPYPEVYLDRNATLPTLQGSSHFFVTLGPNFPTVDAVIITPAHVQLLQVTIATRHNLHQSGLNRVYQLIKHNDMLQGRQWHFVFLAPKKEIADTLCSSAPAQKLLRFARDKLHLDMHLGSMAVPLAHPWTDHPNEVFTEPMELPELPIEESDVDMDP